MDIKVVFMGSPDFAIPVLRELINHYRVTGVVTQPDRPAGRGRVLTPPPVKELALKHGIEVIQPEKLRQPEALAQLRAWQPDLIVVAAFGQILRQNVLDLPRFGCINVHASLLPRWRGAAPIQAAILAGDAETGATIMKMDAGIDTGAMLAQTRLKILPDDTAERLSEKLSEAGAQLLIETLPPYFRNETGLISQPESGSTYAAMIKKEDGLLDFNQPADAIERRIRAYNSWPGAYFFVENEMIKVKRAHVVKNLQLPAGKRGVHENLPVVGAITGSLALDEVQPAGKKAMPGEVFLRGARTWNS
ncbi:MAG: methionyl-tRNA formyltransferase [Anaerolineae bacterium]|nr:methionyl-tRNA formyltransferase [Anaerolineae bacterium]